MYDNIQVVGNTMKSSRATNLSCPNRSCPDFARQRKGNIVRFGQYKSRCGKRKRYLCKSCQATFSERALTIFHRLHTDEDTVLRALAALGEYSSLRAVSRLFEVKLDTLRHWLGKAAQNRPLVAEMLIKDLNLKKAQVDKLWSFIRDKTEIEFSSPET